MTLVPIPKNADLYQAGRQYSAHQARLTAGKKKATWEAVAAACGTERKAVMTATAAAAPAWGPQWP